MDKISTAEICKMGLGVALGYLAYRLISGVDSGAASTKNGSASDSSRKYNKSGTKQTVDQIKKQEQQNKNELLELQEMQQFLIHKSSNFEIHTVANTDGILTKQCLLEFLSSTFDALDSKQVIEITLQSRRARRQVFLEVDSKYETYFRFVCTLDENIKYILEKAQKNFAVFLNMDYQKIMASITYHIEGTDNLDESDQFRMQIVEVMASTRENIANYMPLYNSPIPKQKLTEIIAFQTRILQQQDQHLVELVKKMGLETREQEQALPLFLTCYLEDSIWHTFGVESQQMSIMGEDMDAGLQEQYKNFKIAREKVIRDMHISIQDDLYIQQ